MNRSGAAEIGAPVTDKETTGTDTRLVEGSIVPDHDIEAIHAEGLHLEIGDDTPRPLGAVARDDEDTDVGELHKWVLFHGRRERRQALLR